MWPKEETWGGHCYWIAALMIGPYWNRLIGKSSQDEPLKFGTWHISMTRWGFHLSFNMLFLE